MINARLAVAKVAITFGESKKEQKLEIDTV